MPFSGRPKLDAFRGWRHHGGAQHDGRNELEDLGGPPRPPSP